MLQVEVRDDEVRFGERLSVTFQRTLRLPDDGKIYPLPPGLGRFPIMPVETIAGRAPAAWRAAGGVVIPMYQREALWLGFAGASWKPNAVQVAIGHVNVVSGTAWDERLTADPQNYLVVPYQPWLDGINVGDGTIRQFVAAPLGEGVTVERQVTGEEAIGGLQLRVYEPKPGRFPDQPPPAPELGTEPRRMATAASGAMGLGAGGAMRQRIYPDPYGLDVWDADNDAELFVHIVNSEQFRALTGREPPPIPVDARAYSERGLPWFELYDERRGSVAGSETLRRVQSVQALAAKRTGEADEGAVEIAPEQVRRLEPPGESP